MESEDIKKAVSIWLDEHNALRACGSCPISCDDMTRFICVGGSINYLWGILKKLRLENDTDIGDDDVNR